MPLQQKYAFLFPGQGSQRIGMGLSLSQSFPITKNVFQKADEILGFNLSKICWEGPEEVLNDTVNTQPAILTHSLAAYYLFLNNFPHAKASYVAGHSMGEFSALVASGALGFEDALKLVYLRGRLMKKAGEISPGAMAAILGADIETVEKICLNASKANEIVQVANDNCPGQVVISGSSQALSRAITMALEAGVRKVTPLAVSIAAHSPLMAHAQDDFNQAVKNAPFSEPEIPIIGNVTASPLISIENIQSDICSQLMSRVRWTETIQYMISQGISQFIEFGPGNVLTSLLKRISKEVIGVALGTPEDFEKFMMGEV